MQKYFPRTMKARQHHKPVRSVSELAEEFGVDSRALGKMLSIDPNAPKCELANGVAPTREGARFRYFEPNAVRAWWKKRCAASSTADQG